MGFMIASAPQSRVHAKASRRQMVLGMTSAVVIAYTLPLHAQSQPVILAKDLGIRPGGDAGPALQRALDKLAALGGGILRINDRYRAGILVVHGQNILIDGVNGTLVDTRLVLARQARNITVRGLTLLETRGRSDSYLMDISSSDCQFEDIALIKQPMAGGYQAYLRSDSKGCTFRGLRLMGSNGIFVAGRRHVFDGFDFTSTLRRDMGGDDAFALKGAGTETSDITIANGTVRGFAAAVSIGSEVGSSREHRGRGAVRRVRVTNVTADRCQRLCFIKPGALIYDWRNGVVEDIVMDGMRLMDPAGFIFISGITITAARGARVSGVIARNIRIDARALSRGVMPTAAVDIVIRADKPGAIIENLDLAVDFDGSGQSGYPVDQIVRVQKDDVSLGSMRNISIDVTGREASFAGIYVGPGLDDAVTIRRARLTRVATDPPSSSGAAGIWSDSRIILKDINVEAVRAPKMAGRGQRR